MFVCVVRDNPAFTQSINRDFCRRVEVVPVHPVPRMITDYMDKYTFKPGAGSTQGLEY